MCLGSAPDFVAAAVTLRCVAYPEALEPPLAFGASIQEAVSRRNWDLASSNCLVYEKDSSSFGCCLHFDVGLRAKSGRRCQL